MGSRNGGMRKGWMKRCGTPICAGPGVASENVGFARVGAPSGRLGGGGAALFSARFTRPETAAWMGGTPAVSAPERPVPPVVRVPAPPDEGAFGFGFRFGVDVGVGV